MLTSVAVDLMKCQFKEKNCCKFLPNDKF